MADTYQARILTPDGSLFEGEVRGVQVPGSEGSFEMRVNHSPIVSTLDIGHIRVETADSSIRYFAVTGGFVEMNDNNMTLLAETAERVEDIDLERVMRARERALEQLLEKKTDRLSAEYALKRAENRLRVVEEQREAQRSGNL